jgi:molecular chaperone GrpE
MWERSGVDDHDKGRLLDQFQRYLDSIETLPDETAGGDGGETETDLFTVFVELAALRNEVRGEARLVKDALDQFRAVFKAMQASQATLEQELKRCQSEARDRERATLRPLLLELLELRDRIAAGLRQPIPPASWLDRLLRRRSNKAGSHREGLAIMLRRLDRILGDRRVAPIEVIGRPFDPRLSRAVGTTRNAAVGPGTVVEEIRTGFLWEQDLLRIAEVIVNAADTNR